jgi:hypothetical protein
VAISQGSITVSPGVPGYATARAKQLGLERHTYLALLLHNYLHGPPMALPVVESPSRVVKVRIQLTIPGALRSAATKAGARWKLSLSTLVESLVIADADSEEETLTVAPVRGSEKPVLKIHK